ncbi:hypothetical protein BHE74_00011302 [Ensete ventricosum]|nr:hypothetical protein GW17_00021838 [Ensete ventricosum]RWW80360.1 hypothetical protein BHE74_00011302 [Ensete ventricosum]
MSTQTRGSQSAEPTTHGPVVTPNLVDLKHRDDEHRLQDPGDHHGVDDLVSLLVQPSRDHHQHVLPRIRRMAVRVAVVGARHELRHLRPRPFPELVYGSPSGPPAQPDMVEVRRAGDGEGGVELGYAEQCPEGQKGKQTAAGTKRRGEEELVD